MNTARLSDCLFLSFVQVLLTQFFRILLASATDDDLRPFWRHQLIEFVLVEHARFTIHRNENKSNAPTRALELLIKDKGKPQTIPDAP